MKIAYNTQITNQFKHPQMPDNYPFTVYEIDDSRQSEFELQGFILMTPADYTTYVASIDMTAYNIAIAPPISDIIDSIVASAAIKGLEIVKQFKRENVLMGINAQQTVDVTKKCHWMEHFLIAGSLKAAVIEMDSLIASDLSSYSPFITSARITTYKHIVQDFLGVAQT
jgi:hypothetical protein